MSHLQLIMKDATHYRMLLDVFRSDPTLGPYAAAQMRGIFETAVQQDSGGLNKNRTLQKIHAPY